jgi:myo-inositol-1(or 4)-monophosphatase
MAEHMPADDGPRIAGLTGGLEDLGIDEIDAVQTLCAAIAREAGSFALDARRSLGAGRRAAHDTKSSVTDPVTEFDRSTEALVVARLRAERPADSIVGEEGADHVGTSGFEWHVDPIDGTVNFVYDLPGWCTSIAVVYGGKPVAGAIYAPVVDELYSAGLQRGATVNGDLISTSTASDLSTSLAATGFSYLVDERKRQADRLATILPGVRDIRRQGSAALDLAYVASGRVDTYFEESLNSWDVAAGALVVTEAGGIVTSFDGSPIDVCRPRGVVAAGRSLHQSVLDALARAAV